MWRYKPVRGCGKLGLVHTRDFSIRTIFHVCVAEIQGVPSNIWFGVVNRATVRPSFLKENYTSSGWQWVFPIRGSVLWQKWTQTTQDCHISVFLFKKGLENKKDLSKTIQHLSIGGGWHCSLALFTWLGVSCNTRHGPWTRVLLFLEQKAFFF